MPLIPIFVACNLVGPGCAKPADSPDWPLVAPPQVLSQVQESGRLHNRGHGARQAGAIVFRSEELPFIYNRGETGLAWPVEVTGGGIGLLDFDDDGDLDLFFVQGGPLPFVSSPESPSDVLLRNDGAGRFVDATAEVGLSARGYGQGLAVADYDNDGDQDVYVTRYGRNTLWRNDEKRRFVDVTQEAEVGCDLWSLGAAFLDHDRDGDLDLFVANYFEFDPAEAPFFRDEDGRPDYGLPNQWTGVPDVLYRNEGNGKFKDSTKDAGIWDEGRGMGVLATDFDQNGWVDLLVANDAMANALWINRGDGTFKEEAELSGIGYNSSGMAEANMGIAHGDTDDDGRADILITHLAGEHDTLWRLLSGPLEELVFQDQTESAGLGTASLPLTTWGATLADFDRDGRLDLLVVSGNIRREPGQTYPYEQPPLLMRQVGGGRFVDITEAAGPFFRQRHQARGLATGDLDGDGDLDVVVVRHGEAAVVLWNETVTPFAGLSVELIGDGSARDPVGARLEIEAGGRRQIRTFDGGGGYLSASARALSVGLGEADHVDRLTVRWPSGRRQEALSLRGGAKLRWIEGREPEIGPIAPAP